MTGKQALDISIKHWRDNSLALEAGLKEGKRINETKYNALVESCACCQESLSRMNCSGCLILAYTGHSDCKSTPYYFTPTTESCFKICLDHVRTSRAEWRFLIRVRKHFVGVKV